MVIRERPLPAATVTRIERKRNPATTVAKGRTAMDLGLKGKIALVTGSSRGIGRGVAIALAAEGCDVMLTGRDEKALDEAAAAIRTQGRRAAVAVIDLRKPDGPAKLIEQVKRELGGLDILVNNAGATKRGDL